MDTQRKPSEEAVSIQTFHDVTNDAFHETTAEQFGNEGPICGDGSSLVK